MVAWLLATGFAHAASCTPELGLPPLEVLCELPGDAEDGQHNEWVMGDGTVLVGQVVSHVYEDAGQYTIARSTVSDDGDQLTPTTYDVVTACGPPEAAFTYTFRGGVEYDMLNRTDVLPGCAETVRWTVYEGTARGSTPLLEADTWETFFVFPEEGTYTVFLDVAGMAGASAAKLTIEAEGGLPDSYRRNPPVCATGPASAGWWLALPLLLGWRRR